MKPPNLIWCKQRGFSAGPPRLTALIEPRCCGTVREGSGAAWHRRGERPVSPIPAAVTVPARPPHRAKVASLGRGAAGGGSGNRAPRGRPAPPHARPRGHRPPAPATVRPPAPHRAPRATTGSTGPAGAGVGADKPRCDGKGPSPRSLRVHTDRVAVTRGHGGTGAAKPPPIYRGFLQQGRGGKGLNTNLCERSKLAAPSFTRPLPPPPLREGPRAAAPRGAAVTGWASPAPPHCNPRHPIISGTAQHGAPHNPGVTPSPTRDIVGASPNIPSRAPRGFPYPSPGPRTR